MLHPRNITHGGGTTRSVCLVASNLLRSMNARQPPPIPPNKKLTAPLMSAPVPPPIPPPTPPPHPQQIQTCNMVKLLLLVCIIAGMATAVAHSASAKPTGLRFKAQAGFCKFESTSDYFTGGCLCESVKTAWEKNSSPFTPIAAATMFCRCCRAYGKKVKWVADSCEIIMKQTECQKEENQLAKDTLYQPSCLSRQQEQGGGHTATDQV